MTDTAITFPDSPADLLLEINRGLPKGIDWKEGAREYVKLAFSKKNEAAITSYALTKPMYRIKAGAGSDRALEEAVQYLYNFVNTVQLLKLRPGSRVMDVACGAGWMSHYLNRFGYKTFGFDIAPDFVALAKRRLLEDLYLSLSADDVEEMFDIIDVETTPLGEQHHNQYDAIILESCLHHFYDPISALSHLRECLSEDGVILLIEGENRMGEINKVYMDVMEGWKTIERPYERQQLTRILEFSGLKHFEFVGQVNGFFSPRDPIWGDATARLNDTAHFMNVSVCAKERKAIDRIFPNLSGRRRSVPPPASPPIASSAVLKDRTPLPMSSAVLGWRQIFQHARRRVRHYFE